MVDQRQVDRQLLVGHDEGCWIRVFVANHILVELIANDFLLQLIVKEAEELAVHLMNY